MTGGMDGASATPYRRHDARERPWHRAGRAGRAALACARTLRRPSATTPSPNAACRPWAATVPGGQRGIYPPPPSGPALFPMYTMPKTAGSESEHL